MKLRPILLALCLLTACSLTGCGEKEREIPEEVIAFQSEISPELSSGEFAVDGDMYQLPMTVGDFFDGGWGVSGMYDNADTFTLEAGGCTNKFQIVKSVGEDELDGIWLIAVNDTEEELPLAECNIGYMRIDSPQTCVFPGGIWNYTDVETMKAAYGEPKDYINDSDTFYTLFYDIELEDGTQWEVKFRFSFTIGEVMYTRSDIEV